MPNIVLTGFMGTGKTSVGKRLAQELNLKFFDTDSLIEDEAGIQVKEIFALLGEPRFRELEREVIKKLSQGFYGEGVVAATGGGAVADEENRGLLRRWAAVVCLTASVDEILKRVGDGDERPLINSSPGIPSVERLLNKRKAAYSDCDLTLDTTSISVEDAVKKIKEFILSRGGD